MIRVAFSSCPTICHQLVISSFVVNSRHSTTTKCKYATVQLLRWATDTGVIGWKDW